MLSGVVVGEFVIGRRIDGAVTFGRSAALFQNPT
jgi:hypothetical protein